jgi:hypothetical protein
VIENDKDRKRHILENMLYMCELNKKNVMICHQIFDIGNEYKLNLYYGDTLNFDPKKTFKIDKFDIIVGNPPYNKGGIRSHTGKQLGEKNETIWTKFIEKSFQLLRSNGYMAFINPLSWLKKSHSLHNKMLEKYIIWMKLWDNSQSKMMIRADIPLSLYILQYTTNKKKKTTEITSILKRRNLTTHSNEYLNKDYSIPLAYHSVFNKLIEFIKKNDLRLEYSTKTVKSSGTKKKIPAEYKLDDMLAIDTYTIKEGIMVKKAIVEHPDAGKRKLIIANKASFSGAFIDEGKLGLTGSDKSYIVGDNLEIILKILKFKISDIICHFTKYRQDFLEKEVYTYLPDIRKLGIKDIDEEQFYELIGLTQHEINSFVSDLKNDSEKVSNNEIHKTDCKKEMSIKIRKINEPELIDNSINVIPCDANDEYDNRNKKNCKKEMVKKVRKLKKNESEKVSNNEFCRTICKKEITRKVKKVKEQEQINVMTYDTDDETDEENNNKNCKKKK